MTPPTQVPLDSFSHHGGSVLSTEPLRVQTSSIHWDYAISLPMRFDPASHVRGQPFSAAARVTVERGELGVLVVGDDWTTPLGEAPPAIVKGSHTVFLTWEASGFDAILMFRNTGTNDLPCVFRVDFLVLGSTPPLLAAPATGLEYITGPSPRGGTAMLLLLREDSLSLHNQAQRLGDGGEFLSDPAQWGYSLSTPIEIPSTPEGRLQPLVTVDVHVIEGAVGVAIVDDDWLRFVTPEVDTAAAPRPERIELRVESGGARVRLMVRNVSDAGPSRFKVLGVSLQFVVRTATLLVEKASPPIGSILHSPPLVTGVFDVLISHSSRFWIAEQCDRGYLRERWAKPGRLENLPAFDTLSPHAAPYYGLLSVFRIELTSSGASGRVLRHYVSSEKVVHAALMERKVVIVFDDGVAIFAREDDASIAVDASSGQRVTDPWFGGLHTVIPVDDTTCLLSSSGADAILWLDTRGGSVVRRWRLPADHYGTNYDLDETTWLDKHYVANPYQLGHLNCAAPDGRGGVFISVLGQGDIGHVSASGEYQRLVTDFVGCHGVRFVPARDLLYFSDSCSGRLMRVDGPNRTTPLFETGSRWLHDAVHLTAGLFLMTVADRNSLLLVDTERTQRVAEWNFGASEGTLQFLSVAAAIADRG